MTTGEKLDPCTGQVQSVYCKANYDDVYLAVRTAKHFQKEWRALGRVKRSEVLANALTILTKNAKQYAFVISSETGKNINESMAEVLESKHMLEYTVAQGRAECGKWLPSEMADRDVAIIRKPKGVVAVISP